MTPDPLDASTYNHRFVTVYSGRRYHLVDQPPAHWRGSVEDAPTILMCHGFPDLWYGWRYQIAAFAACGFRILCPSQLGYCGSSQPGAVEAYSYKSVAYDMNGLLDAVGAGKVIVFGHDWGGMVAWRFADYFPHRVICIASVCTPYMPPAGPSTPYVSTIDLVRTKLPNFGYQAFFEREDAASKIEPVLEQFLAVNFSATVRGKFVEAGRELPQFPVKEGEMESNIDRMMREKRSGKAKPVPKDPEYQYYLDTFSRHGLHHPLNWYRTRRINHTEEQASRLPAFSPDIPALMIPAEKDPALPPAMAKSPAVMKSFPGGNLRVLPVVKEADHWLLQDVRFRDRVTDMLADFVDEVLSGKWKPEAAPSKL
ncbi:soluble epoxide hydrolase [Rhodotorula toruloides]|uniref:Soluble epoxide hydrolase n=1 Tax=Rhodotorula toruloides TaxID=5286 RepID=A0A511K6Y2_RHOTO|nr:soluble epoxide hydrolase [Rhodotorula toruloides]